MPFTFTGKIVKLNIKIDRPKLSAAGHQTSRNGRPAEQPHKRVAIKNGDFQAALGGLPVQLGACTAPQLARNPRQERATQDRTKLDLAVCNP